MSSAADEVADEDDEDDEVEDEVSEEDMCWSRWVEDVLAIRDELLVVLEEDDDTLELLLLELALFRSSCAVADIVDAELAALEAATADDALVLNRF